MTLQQLQYFLAACEHRTFSSAADACYIAQPSLAAQVRRLEEELGAKLFIRGPRRLSLTEAGKALEPRAREILAGVKSAVAEVSSVRGIESGTASLGTFSLAYRYLVQEVVTGFVAQYPDVGVRVIGQNSAEVVEMIRSGELEAGLITLPIDDEALEVRPVMTDDLLYVELEGSGSSEPMSVERLATQRLIFYDAHFGSRDPTRRQLAERARDAGVPLEGAIEVETLDAAISLAAQGLGGTYVLETIAQSNSFPQVLSAVPFDPPLFETFAFVQQRGAQLSPATRELVRLAEIELANYNKPPRSGNGEDPPSHREGKSD
ncbi:MAG: LysR family transcriptional regulator [Actinobacteria bacterium]|nr:LysR family transcriptional regulator [Actinomycetota bacterium]